MGHFAPAEPQGNFDLVTFFEKAANGLHFDLVIMVINARTQFDFLNLDGFLLFTGFGSLFLLLEFEFAIIEYFTNGGRGIGRDFNEI